MLILTKKLVAFASDVLINFGVALFVLGVGFLIFTKDPINVQSA